MQSLFQFSMLHFHVITAGFPCFPGGKAPLKFHPGKVQQSPPRYYNRVCYISNLQTVNAMNSYAMKVECSKSDFCAPNVCKMKKRKKRKEELSDVLELKEIDSKNIKYFWWNCLLLFLFFSFFFYFEWLLMLTMLSTESCLWLSVMVAYKLTAYKKTFFKNFW